ncbi:RNA-guided endonuclease TnpB family protein, partial [Streptomyces sp. NPDC005507]
VEMGRKHGRWVHLVHPAHTTMDCADCGARTKLRAPGLTCRGSGRRLADGRPRRSRRG